MVGCSLREQRETKERNERETTRPNQNCQLFQIFPSFDKYSVAFSYEPNQTKGSNAKALQKQSKGNKSVEECVFVFGWHAGFFFFHFELFLLLKKGGERNSRLNFCLARKDCEARSSSCSEKVAK